MVSSLDDGCSLLFLYRVTNDVEDAVREYEAICASAESLPLRAYVAARADWLRNQRLRRIRTFLFFSSSAISLSAVGRGALGGKLVFGKAEAISRERHHEQLKQLAQLRDRIVGRFALMGIAARELAPEDLWRIHYQLLNPGCAQRQLAPPEVAVRDNIWSEGTLTSV